MDDEKKEVLENEDELLHYGTPRHSGRYPWGSGENPYQNSGDFLSRYEELKKQGLNENEIAESYGIKSPQLRAQLILARAERRGDLYDKAKSLKEDGLSNPEIAARLNMKGESSVRSLLNSESEIKMRLSEKTADFLREAVDKKGMVDIGAGIERELGISPEKMRAALEILKFEGYEVWSGRVPQVTNKGKQTTLKVLCVPGTKHREIYDYDKIHQINDVKSMDGGETFEPKFKYPSSLKSERIYIRYAEDGGSDKDGVVELRRGVKDISLGESNYAQVRILVDDTHYIKGMALYSNDIPEGYDMLFNTNKSNKLPKHDVLKKIKDDPENPFGSSIKENGGQSYYTDENGEKKLSLINKRADEGDWGDWSKELSSQFLSKQPMKLIQKQLDLALTDKQDEYDEIMSLTNPSVKKALLIAFSDDCDAAAVHLKAAPLPGQTYKVILPINSLKDNEVYNPLLEDGSQMALIRYPHGGTFEIPILTNNIRNKEAINVLTSNPVDAIGINSNVAKILSGADFDGDTVMVIPINNKTKIKSRRPLEKLEGFDGKLEYGPDGIKIINGVEHYFRGGREYSILKESNTQLQMGIISNLITDMTLKGADIENEVSKAVKHSMVIIDANKHKLDYKKSEKDNDILMLRRKYQSQVDEFGRPHLGASTLISKSKSEIDIPERKEGMFVARDTGNELVLIDEDNKIYLDKSNNKVYSEKEKKTLYIDPTTGEKLYRETGREFSRVHYRDSNNEKQKASVRIKDGRMYYKDVDGNYIWVTNEKVEGPKLALVKSTRMETVKDARELSSGLPQEEAYAEYANRLKSLANKSRKESIMIQSIPYSPAARATYEHEYRTLANKLNIAKLNAPRERQAQIIATSAMKAKKMADPGMTDEKEKKLKQQALTNARARVGAIRNEVIIDANEWNAIQSGAISKTMLDEIIANANLDVLRKLAMPRSTTILSDNKIRRIKNMAASGYATIDIAKSLGVSVSTINEYLKGGE